MANRCFSGAATGDSALKVANWLADHAKIARVLHPALPSCPGHAHWQRDFLGASGLFGFELQGSDASARDRMIDGLDLFGIGWSWGGFESLAVPSDATGRALPRPASGPVVRLSIGLEDPDDLIADLDSALAEYP